MALPQTSDEQFNQRYTNGSTGNQPPVDRSRKNRSRDSDTLRRTASRNTSNQPRTSSMPGSPSNQAVDSTRPSTDKIFAASYAKQGLQPSYSTADTDKAPAYTQPPQLTRSAQVEYSSQPMVSPGVQTQSQRIRLRKKHNELAPVARVRVTSVNVWLISWGLFFWIWFQLPLAVISAGFFGLAGWVDALEADAIANPSLLETAAGLAISFTRYASNIIMGLTGINIEILNPENIFILTNSVVFAFGMITLLTVYFTYLISFLRPLSGQHEVLKKGMLPLYIAGYFFPIANIFPWFLAWTIVVWFYPK